MQTEQSAGPLLAAERKQISEAAVSASGVVPLVNIAGGVVTVKVYWQCCPVLAGICSHEIWESGLTPARNDGHACKSVGGNIRNQWPIFVVLLISQ